MRERNLPRWLVPSVIQREILKQGGHRGERVPPAGGNATPDDGQSAEPGCVLGKDLDRTDWRAVFKRLGEEGRQGSLKLGHDVRTFFPCEGRGRCGLTCSL